MKNYPKTIYALAAIFVVGAGSLRWPGLYSKNNNLDDTRIVKSVSGYLEKFHHKTNIADQDKVVTNDDSKLTLKQTLGLPDNDIRKINYLTQQFIKDRIDYYRDKYPKLFLLLSLNSDGIDALVALMIAGDLLRRDAVQYTRATEAKIEISNVSGQKISIFTNVGEYPDKNRKISEAMAPAENLISAMLGDQGYALYDYFRKTENIRDVFIVDFNVKLRILDELELNDDQINKLVETLHANPYKNDDPQSANLISDVAIEISKQYLSDSQISLLKGSVSV